MRSCEVCSGLDRIGTTPSRPKKPRTRRVLVGERIVLLCDDHAAKVLERGAEDAAELQELFMEPGGRRSLVGRRSPLNRRIFPARPEGRRASDGRRRDDVVD